MLLLKTDKIYTVVEKTNTIGCVMLLVAYS